MCRKRSLLIVRLSGGFVQHQIVQELDQVVLVRGGHRGDSPALDRLFQRSIRLTSPKPPISGADYVDNWEELRAFIEHSMQRIKAGQLSGR